MAKERLQKVLAAAGVDSRRRCEELILSGSVRVNGQVVDTLPVFVEPASDIITVDGKRIGAVKKVYYLLNKPKNVLCADYDPKGRPTAIDFIGCRQRIFCIGRLDADTTGLIILTNDTEMANRMTHPRFGLSKTYVAKVAGTVAPAQVEKLKKGIWLAEGKTQAVRVTILNRSRQMSILEIVIRQGINRQVPRMLAKVGLKVKTLASTKIGKIDSHGLSVGKFRPLKSDEIVFLKKITAVDI